MNLKQAIDEKWYVQGVNSTPLLIVSAALSSLIMKKWTGLTYKNFLFTYEKGDYGDMHYSINDLEELGKILEKKIEEDPDYFVKIKKIYDKQIEESNKFYKKLDGLDFSSLSEEELIELLKKTSECISIAVGVAHIIEPFALTTDIKIKNELEKYVKDKKESNKIFTLLMSPIKESFVNRYEKSLKEISEENNDKKREELIKKIIKFFFWIRNGYAGRYVLTKKDIEDESTSIKEKKLDFEKIIDEKKELIEKLKLSEDLIKKIKATEFLTHWQDERKENILIAIDYTDKLLEELSKRIDFDISYLRYILPGEISLRNIKSEEFKDELKKRRKGCVYLYDESTPKIISGEEHESFLKQFEKEKLADIKELTGMTASAGTVTGIVKVCRNIKSLDKVEEGDILVASMTRPEYVPAMRKAAAIITDEGGITCHAAIVARELGIPCIIGTKIATKILKDNDLIEIKGNHGLIIVLKRGR
jgi:phosphoenolpyruvate synthase/pyruvate phosphate dikinase